MGVVDSAAVVQQFKGEFNKALMLEDNCDEWIKLLAKAGDLLPIPEDDQVYQYDLKSRVRVAHNLHPFEKN